MKKFSDYLEVIQEAKKITIQDTANFAIGKKFNEIVKIVSDLKTIEDINNAILNSSYWTMNINNVNNEIDLSDKKQKNAYINILKQSDKKNLLDDFWKKVAQINNPCTIKIYISEIFNKQPKITEVKKWLTFTEFIKFLKNHPMELSNNNLNLENVLKSFELSAKLASNEGSNKTMQKVIGSNENKKYIWITNDETRASKVSTTN
jgi:hypothetical protein